MIIVYHMNQLHYKPRIRIQPQLLRSIRTNISFYQLLLFLGWLGSSIGFLLGFLQVLQSVYPNSLILGSLSILILYSFLGMLSAQDELVLEYYMVSLLDLFLYSVHCNYRMFVTVITSVQAYITYFLHSYLVYPEQYYQYLLGWNYVLQVIGLYHQKTRTSIILV